MNQPKSQKIVFHGKNLQGHLYTVNIDIVDKAIVGIAVLGRPNLFVKEMCERFARKSPKNVRDVVACIKLEMIKRCEFQKEVRDGEEL